MLTRPAPPPDLTFRYGPHPDHVVDLRLPPGQGADPARAARPAAEPDPEPRVQERSVPERPEPAPLVVVLHGGFWRAEYDRTHTGPMASALAAAGYAVAIPEFRRAGQPGGGWPGTFDDVAAMLDALPELLGGRVRPGPAVLVGHSAGGHLALWAAGRHRLDPGSRWYRRRPAGTRPHAVVAMAAMADLVRGSKEKLGDRAVDALLGGPPWRRPKRYAATDPARLVPLDAPVTLIHGVADDRVPVEISRGYAARARAAGDTVELIELPAADHFAVIDPLSAAWPRVLDAIAAGANVRYGEQAVDGHG